MTVCLHLCSYIYIYMNMYINMYMYIYICIYVYICIYAYMCIGIQEEAYAEGQEDENSRETGATIISRELAK